MRRSHITAAMPTINRPVNRIRTTDIPVILCAFSLDKVKLFFYILLIVLVTFYHCL